MRSATTRAIQTSANCLRRRNSDSNIAEEHLKCVVYNSDYYNRTGHYNSLRIDRSARLELQHCPGISTRQRKVLFACALERLARRLPPSRFSRGSGRLLARPRWTRLRRPQFRSECAPKAGRSGRLAGIGRVATNKFDKTAAFTKRGRVGGGKPKCYILNGGHAVL